MSCFLEKSSLLVKSMYIITILLFIYYFILKYKYRKYLFSIFNITSTIVVPMVIPFIILGPFQYNNEAWIKLGYDNAEWFIKFLDKNFVINLFGICIFILYSIFFEFRSKEPKRINKILNFFQIKVASLPIFILNILTLIVWYVLVLKTEGSMPIFSDRNFAGKYGVQTIYNTLNVIIFMLSTCYLAKYFSKRKLVYLALAILNILTMFFTGNRGPVLFLIFNVTILFIYMNTEKINNVNKKIIILSIIILIAGIGMNFIRSKDFDNISTNSLTKDIVYGNTFSDLRDGAFVLYGFNLKYDEYMYGKNYIADILGFIPSSKSQYRQKWSYGRFVTYDLFGWENHYGLRGGLFLEPYINFGFIGIIIFSIIFAYFSSLLEKIFYDRFVLKNNIDKIEIQLLIMDIIKTIAFSLMVTSGFPEVYPKLIIIAVAVLVSLPIRKTL